MSIFDLTSDDFDALRALIYEHGPSEAQRILRRERRAARAREEGRARRAVATDENRTVQP
jgi:hypothetical protein